MSASRTDVYRAWRHVSQSELKKPLHTYTARALVADKKKPGRILGLDQASFHLSTAGDLIAKRFIV
jgi:hypothetical protein